MELPLDHFRLIGVSPSATSEEILRAFQLRLDKTPDEGFTYEVLTQRSELLRQTADLLTEPETRREYENILLKGASGLEFSSNREVAGLILLWESGSPKDAFKIARKALQPPQTPALGSSREADLTLLVALTARDSAVQEQEVRSYTSAAEFLQEGIQLLQRMGKLSGLREDLEEYLISLLPYRILDLLSSDLNDQESHKKGLNMLENLINKRGGLEGKNKSEYSSYLNQQEFEIFFQQIRPYLTVQEQIDLFLELQKRGSLEAGFLAFLSLTAMGFSRRKPEKLFEARKILKKLNLSGLDSMPLIGCLDLLLADVEQASARFLSSSDEKLRDWLQNYPGETLEAICIFCKNWLENDVLVGYRDINSNQIDLNSWFEDREIQEFIEKIEKKSNKIYIKSKFQSQQKNIQESSESSIEDSYYGSDSVDERRLPWPGGVKKQIGKNEIEENNFNEQEFKNKSLAIYKYFIEKMAEFKFGFGEFIDNKNLLTRSSYLTYFYAFLLLFAFGIGFGLFRNIFYKSTENEKLFDNSSVILEKDKNVVEKNIIDENKKKPNNLNKNTIEQNLYNPFQVKEITSASPSLEQIKYLINTWLTTKSNYLAGKGEIDLSLIVQDGLIKRTINERNNDIKKNLYKEISSEIQEIEITSQNSSRIVVNVELKYIEKIIRETGELINQTSLSPLKVKYILGFSNKSWKLADFISGQ